MVLTSTHLAKFLHNIEFLQNEGSSESLFKMAEMNKEVNEIVQGRRIL